MGYVAVKGGAEAIENAARLCSYLRVKGGSKPLDVRQIKEQLYLAVDRAMGEGSLYAPDLAALAIKQSMGDSFEASFMLRAYRATRPRIGYSVPRDTGGMRVSRRISAIFKDIPGGQILGPTTDYTLRLLDFSLANEAPADHRIVLKEILSSVRLDGHSRDEGEESLPKVVDILRHEGLLVGHGEPSCEISDVTRDSLEFPASRSAALQTMARGDTGGMLLLAYSNMRGYGSVHPTIGELRVGYLPLTVKHPRTGAPYVVGEIKVTEAEIISKFDSSEGEPRFTLGYGICFGHNEVKAISMAVLDRAMMSKEPKAPSEDQEFVLSHIDGIESMGFCIHFKLPHYVTFQSDLDRIRKAREAHKEEKSREEGSHVPA